MLNSLRPFITNYFEQHALDQWIVLATLQHADGIPSVHYPLRFVVFSLHPFLPCQQYRESRPRRHPNHELNSLKFERDIISGIRVATCPHGNTYLVYVILRNPDLSCLFALLNDRTTTANRMVLLAFLRNSEKMQITRRTIVLVRSE